MHGSLRQRFTHIQLHVRCRYCICRFLLNSWLVSKWQWKKMAPCQMERVVTVIFPSFEYAHVASSTHLKKHQPNQIKPSNNRKRLSSSSPKHTIPPPTKHLTNTTNVQYTSASPHPQNPHPHSSPTTYTTSPPPPW